MARGTEECIGKEGCTMTQYFRSELKKYGCPSHSHVSTTCLHRLFCLEMLFWIHSWYHDCCLLKKATHQMLESLPTMQKIHSTIRPHQCGTAQALPLSLHSQRCLHYIGCHLLTSSPTIHNKSKPIYTSTVTFAFAFVTLTPNCFALARISTLFLAETACEISAA